MALAAESKQREVAVIGVGYVGLPMALLMAKAGHKVLGVDVDERAVAGLNNHKPHLDEPGLPELAQDPQVMANLRGSKNPAPADIFIIAVPTPLRRSRRSADLDAVEAATQSVVPHLRRGNLVVLESTVPPRTCREVVIPILERGGLKAGADFKLAHCPERVLPGRALEEIINNDRIIGGIDSASTEAAAELYGTFVKGALVRTDDVTAELCKLMENTYRDVNIALANEFSLIAGTLGIDIHTAIDIANRHPRVDILRPGIGVGGHCIPIDPWFITEVDPASCRLIPAARQINDDRPRLIASLCRRAVADIADPKVLCVGITYKADTYDLRESPALEVAEQLKNDGYDITVFDPITREYGGKTLQEAAKGKDLLAVLVPHKKVMEQLSAAGDEIRSAMRSPRILHAHTGDLHTLLKSMPKQHH